MFSSLTFSSAKPEGPATDGGGAENAVERATVSEVEDLPFRLCACASFCKTVEGCCGGGFAIALSCLRGKEGCTGLGAA